MSVIEKVGQLLARWLNWLAAAGIIVAMIIVCVNVIGRDFFGKPFKGTVDIVGLLGAFIIGGAIAHTQVIKGHIRIDMFVERLPARMRYIIASVITLMSLILFALISWQAILYTISNYEIGELSEVMDVPITPFAAFVAICFIVLTLVLLVDLIKSISKAVEK